MTPPDPTKAAREIIAREIDSYIGDSGCSDEMADVVLAALSIEGWQLVRWPTAMEIRMTEGTTTGGPSWSGWCTNQAAATELDSRGREG